jgi:hypothetical protein
MLAPKLLAINLIALVVIMAVLACVDRYASRHPYGTGHFAKVERKRRTEEARRRRREESDDEAKARNEAVMAELLAQSRRGDVDTGTSRSDLRLPPRGSPPARG